MSVRSSTCISLLFAVLWAPAAPAQGKKPADTAAKPAVAQAPATFKDHKLAAIETAPDQERAAVFLQCWTRFEARVKALGLSIGDRVEATRALASCALELGPSHVGTLAVEASSLPEIRYFEGMVLPSIGTRDPASEQRLD